MEQYTRKALFVHLTDYCHCAGKDDFIEVTEWANGEGLDVNINSTHANQIFQLTWGELKALKKLAKKLESL